MAPLISIQANPEYSFLKPEYLKNYSFPREAFLEMEIEAADVEDNIGEANYMGLKEFAFVGRSNVGKSSIINSMLQADIVEASRTPGKTRKIAYVKLPHENIYLVDCPGYGYANVSKKERESWK
jgi:GTP-binding protein